MYVHMCTGSEGVTPFLFSDVMPFALLACCASWLVVWLVVLEKRKKVCM